MYIVYGRDNCPACEQTKKLLESKKLEFKYLKVGSDVTIDELLQKCPEPIRTVPQIFKDNDYIGGFDQCYKYVTAMAS